MQMMNYHKVSEQDRIKFELSMLFTVIEESYNIDCFYFQSFSLLQTLASSPFVPLAWFYQLFSPVDQFSCIGLMVSFLDDSLYLVIHPNRHGRISNCFLSHSLFPVFQIF